MLPSEFFVTRDKSRKHERIETQTRLGVDAHIKYQLFFYFGSSKAAIEAPDQVPDQVQDDLESSDVSTQPISEFLPYAIKP